MSTAPGAPRISVIVPVFNGASRVGDALASIAAQTAGTFQVIAVDDGSLDDSVAAIEHCRADLEAQGHELMVLQHDANRGVADARNTGIAAADGAFVAFLDQDDEWLPDRTAMLQAALELHGADAVFGRMQFIDDTTAREAWHRPEWFAEPDHRGNAMGALLVRRTVFEHVGLLPAGMRSGYDDVDWILRLRDSSLAVVDIDHLVLKRHVHDSNHSRQAAQQSADLLAAVRAHQQRRKAASP